ncbi:predicted protein [Histoplasma capsulatum var. duboisii H88]|uniref:Predicted protein n=1 Tax=Ajellomyces capsulatus (strain H88) TaxID=544711 RepID=F0USS8_AJEC8|nr:predicted protein [Histoplasma capsulatum var. duboisii H88]
MKILWQTVKRVACAVASDTESGKGKGQPGSSERWECLATGPRSAGLWKGIPRENTTAFPTASVLTRLPPWAQYQRLGSYPWSGKSANLDHATTVCDVINYARRKCYLRI